jgi:hypothetical protein
VSRQLRPERPAPNALRIQRVGKILGITLAILVVALPAGFLVGRAAATTIVLSITSSANPVDAGRPFDLVANTPGYFADYSFNWTDSLGGTSTSPNWTLDIATPCTLNVSLHVNDTWGNNGSATITIDIRPPPSITVSAPTTQVEAGVPAPFLLSVAGGVPPINVTWNLSDGGANGSAGFPADGAYLEEADFPVPGPAWISARAVDTLGDPASTAARVAEVVPAGWSQLSASGSVAEARYPFNLTVVVENGAPPFAWSLASSIHLDGVVGPFGTFPSDGVYPLPVVFTDAGFASLNLTLVDALGAVTNSSLVVPVLPPLSVSVTSPARETGLPFPVTTNLSGGLAPYVCTLQLSDGEAINGTLVGPGSLTGVFDPPASGNYTLVVHVTDALGQIWVSTEKLRLDPGASPAGSGTASSLAAGLLVTSIVVLLVGLFAYRRFRSAPATGPGAADGSALPVVRQLLQRSQVIDRATLMVLGEEAGESTDSVQTALQTLIRSGEVTAEPGAAGDEVLRWKGAGSPAPSGEDAP